MDAKNDIILRSLIVLAACLGLKFGTSDEVGSPAGIGNELGDSYPVTKAIEQARSGEETRSDASILIRLGPGYRAVHSRVVRRSCFSRDLICPKIAGLRGQDLRMILERQRFGVG